MEKNRTSQICCFILVIIFALIISIPLMLINRDPNKISVLENRKLAALPSIRTQDGKANTSFITQFEDYINDNIGFKQRAVEADVALNYKIFGKLKVPGFMIGSDGHVYYENNGVGISTYQGVNSLNSEMLKTAAECFSAMGRYFQNRGASFFVMTIPNKENIYPEYYPKTINRFSDKTDLDLLTEYLQNNTNLDAFSVKSELLQQKNNELLYFRNLDSTHWNGNGAFVGYSKLMEEIKNKFPNIKVLAKNDFTIREQKSSGTLFDLSSSKIVCSTMNMDDTLYWYDLKKGFSGNLSKTPPVGVNVNKNSGFIHYINSKSNNSLKILVVGDSYLLGGTLFTSSIKLISESFSDVYFTRYVSTEDLVGLQDAVKPDIVVYETVERAFYYDWTIEQLDKFKKIDAK